MIQMTVRRPGRYAKKILVIIFSVQFYSRIINHHGQPVKIGPNETIEPIKRGLINGAFTTENVTPRVGEVLKRKKIDKFDLISRNETVKSLK